MGGTTAARFAMEPGWSWEACVKPVAGIEPGHNAEIVGDEPFVGFEFQAKAAEEYARQ